MSEYTIPFNRSALLGRELEYISQTLITGQIAGDQAFSKKCQQLLEQSLGVRRALVATSCTHALEMAALLLDVKPGDEVIVPSFTFVSTANAFALRDARIVFADIRLDTLNLDEAKLPALITPRTRVIVPVHYAGVGCEMDPILALASKQGVSVVEDNAHGLFGRYKNRWLGTFGCLATQSFHETKNITCGEGGALLVNDPALIERAEIIREKGTNRSRFFRGQVDKYTWVDLGSSYVMSDVLARFNAASVADVWRTLPAAYESLSIPISVVDSMTHVVGNSVDLQVVLYEGDIFIPYIMGGVIYKTTTVVTEQDGKDPQSSQGGGLGPNLGAGLGIRLNRAFTLKLSYIASPGATRQPGDAEKKKVWDKKVTLGLSYQL